MSNLESNYHKKYVYTHDLVFLKRKRNITIQISSRHRKQNILFSWKINNGAISLLMQTYL